MNPKGALIALAFLVGTSLAQVPPSFFGPGFHGGFHGFGAFAPSQIAGNPSVPGGNGRSNTGTTVQGPILFPPAPESRDTSGVIIGASGYGFVPPSGNEIVQGRGFPQSSAFKPSLSQSFGDYFQF